ncbi:MAG: iron ABC transporter substrate-binding protein [Alphaproteobacteria bacterium HGW-Alphaproteobacteria-2]|nr:MAG: iron ABC transporter substrate-binding protein [Alphaproteobacteria bacterium HGW-Alphaproteobacteria-2]
MSFIPRSLVALAGLATALPALAQEVNVYSYRQPELIAPLTEAFTRETGIKVNVAHLDKGMVERLTAEGSRSPADLVFTVDIARLSAVVEAGHAAPVTTEALTANVPENYRDPDGQWYGLTTRARVVYAAKDRVEPGELTTYEELADPKWKGRICSRSGLHPYNVSLVAAMIHHHGDVATRAWLQGVKANLARKPQGGDRDQAKAVWAGECDNGGTHVNISGVALTKSAPNRENALKLMEFLVSPRAQEIYAEANFEYPIAPGTQPSAVVQSWGSFTPDDVNLMTLAELRPAAVRLIEQVDFDG